MTKKKQLLAALAVSTVALTQAGLVSADEVSIPGALNDVSVVAETQPIDPSTPIVPPTPPDPSTPPTTPGVPPDPSTPPATPDVPTTPETPPSTDGSDTDNSGGDNNPGTGGDTENPSNPGTGGDTENPSNPGTGGDTENPSNPGIGGDTTTPSNPSQPSNPPITDDAVNKDGQGNITVKPQVVAPNQTVVGTQNGQLLVQDTSGNTRLADVTEFGGQKNANGTVSFKTTDGKTVTLPETGSTSGTLLSLLGSMLLGFVGFLWKKKQSL